MTLKDHFVQPSIERSIFLMALLAIIESLQLLIVVVLIFSFIPIHLTDFAKDLFPYQQPGVNPKREMMFLHIWIMTSFVFHIVGLHFLKRKLGHADTDRLLLRLLAVDGWWLLLQLFTVFKMIMYAQAAWPKHLFYIVFGMSLLSRFFWVEIDAFLLNAHEILPRWSSGLKLRLGLDAVVLLFMAFALWIFDQQRLWAVIDLAGNRNMADEAWQALSPLIKGVDYQSALSWLVILSIMYYSFFYLLLRLLCGSRLLAGCGVLLAVKWQYFHNGVTPDIWQFPLKTIIPLLPDVFFWLCLWAHSSSKTVMSRARSNLKQWSLPSAGLVLGFYLAYHFPTAIWLLAAWVSHLLITRTKPVWSLLPLIICLGIWFIFLGFQGTEKLTHQYYSSLIQALQGQGGLPYYDCLRGRNFFAFSVQFIIPIIYLLTIIILRERSRVSPSGKISLKSESFILIPVSIYGLGLLTQHVWQPSLTNYYSVCSPLVIVLCFWGSQVMARLPVDRRMIISALFLVIYSVALVTNNLFGIYPNAWNVGGVNWEEIKMIHQQRLSAR